MAYSILNTRNGKVETVNALTQGDALRAYCTIRKREIEADLTGKRVNTLRYETRVADGAYELRQNGKPLYRFSLAATYYTPSRQPDADRDGRQSDWTSGKFHR